MAIDRRAFLGAGAAGAALAFIPSMHAAPALDLGGFGARPCTGEECRYAVDRLANGGKVDA